MWKKWKEIVSYIALVVKKNLQMFEKTILDLWPKSKY
jgi:hypothetical protein